MWTAPEHIFNGGNPWSQAGDMFSYAIILVEIVTRGLPYGMYEDYENKGKKICSFLVSPICRYTRNDRLVL